MTRDWSYLPRDLLSLIAEGLGLIDFLSFRGVCKDWRLAVASSKISPQNESLGYDDPWFLKYEEGEEGSLCSLLSNEDKLYTMSIPELNGGTCLASYEGWLLISRRHDGLLFFFCPFSNAKIELPTCPFPQVTDHVAAISSVPTSQDCTVVVANRCGNCELEVFLIRRGHQVWSNHRFSNPNEFKSIRTAFYYRRRREFYFLDGEDVMITFDASNTKELSRFYYRLVSPSLVKSTDKFSTLHHVSRSSPFQLISQKREEEFIEENVSISTCGTVIPAVIGNVDHDIVFRSESIDAAEGSKSRHLKGVWIQPRYVYVPPGQSW